MDQRLRLTQEQENDCRAVLAKCSPHWKLPERMRSKMLKTRSINLLDFHRGLSQRAVVFREAYRS